MSFGAGAGDAGGYETTDAEGNVRIGSGRGSDTAGRQETYFRRHDPMAPGGQSSLGYPGGPVGVDPDLPISADNPRRSDPVGKGGTEGRPNLMEAFTYHSYDKFTPQQNAARLALSLLPGGGAVQTLMAGGAALNDMFGDPKDFGRTDFGQPDIPDVDYGNEMVVAKKKRVASTQGAAAPGTTAASGVKPKKAVGVGGSSVDSSPKRTRVAAGGASTILTSPFGDLSQAPTAKKMLLGA